MDADTRANFNFAKALTDVEVKGTSKQTMMARAEKAHKELKDYFAKIDCAKSGAHSSSNSTAEDQTASSNNMNQAISCSAPQTASNA
jgi:hypothetical protein